MKEETEFVSGEQLEAILFDCLDSVMYGKLVFHTIQRLRGRYGLNLPPPEIKDLAQELVQSLLEAVLVEKKRKWNTEKYLEAEDFLRSAIDSHLYNYFNKKKTNFQNLDSPEGVGQMAYQTSTTPEDSIITEETKESVRKLLAEWEADDDEVMVFECLFEGLSKPREIREELGINEAEFGAIWRRVKRKQQKLQQKIN